MQMHLADCTYKCDHAFFQKNKSVLIIFSKNLVLHLQLQLFVWCKYRNVIAPPDVLPKQNLGLGLDLVFVFLGFLGLGRDPDPKKTNTKSKPKPSRIV